MSEVDAPAVQPQVEQPTEEQVTVEQPTAEQVTAEQAASGEGGAASSSAEAESEEPFSILSEEEAKIKADLIKAQNETVTMSQYFERWRESGYFRPMKPNKRMSPEREKQVVYDLEARRFFLQMAARDSMGPAIVRKIDAATTENDLRFCGKAKKGTRLRKVWDLLEKERDCRRLFDKADEFTAKVLEEAAAQGISITLKEGEVNNGFISKDAIDRLRKEFNVTVVKPYPIDGPTNKFIAAAKTAALESQAMIEAGAPLVGAESALTGEEDPGDSAVMLMREGILQAAMDKAFFSQQMDKIRTSDGDHTHGVSFNADAFHEQCKTHSFRTKHWSETPIKPTLIARFYAHISASTDGSEANPNAPPQVKSSAERISGTWIEHIAGLPVNDCAVFVSELYMALKGKPVGRTTHFSEVFHTYVAALAALKASEYVKTQAKLEIENARIVKRAKRMAKAAGVDLSSLPADLGKHLSVEDTTRISVENGKAVREKLQLIELAEWEKSVRAILTYFTVERDQRDNSTEKTVGEVLPNLGSQLSSKGDGQIADVEERYLQRLWVVQQNLAIGILRALEGALLSQLQEFFPMEFREILMTSDIPREVHVPQLVVDRIDAVNHALSLHRASLTADLHGLGVLRSLYDSHCVPFVDDARTKKFNCPLRTDPVPVNEEDIAATDDRDSEINVPPPAVASDLLPLRVCMSQPWSPTIERMLQIHCDVLTLSRFTPDRERRLSAITQKQLTKYQRTH